MTLLCALPCFAYGEDEPEPDPVFSQGEVIVTGDRTPVEKSGSIEEITAEDIRAMGARNVAQALALASGIRVDTAPTSISSNGKGEFLGSLRGFDPRNIIVLIDGIPVYEPYFRVLDLRQIPVADIAKIKIIKGPTSVLYGPNAMGGVINIITRKGTGPPRAHLEGTYGDVNTYTGQGSIFGSHKWFGYFFSPSFEKSDGYPVSAEMEDTRNQQSGLRNNSDYQDFSLAGKFDYSNGPSSLALSVSHYEFTGGIPFSMEAAQPGTLWRKNWKKTSVSLHGQTATQDFFFAKGKVFYSRFYNTIKTFQDATISSVADHGDAVSTYDNDVFGFYLMPQFLFGQFASVEFSTLYKYDQVSIQDEVGMDWRDFGAETISQGGQFQSSFYKFSLTIGGAYHFYRRTETPRDDLGTDNDAFDYMAGLAYSPIEYLDIFTAAAHKSSFPDLKTLYSSQGNPELESEYAINIDAGARTVNVPHFNIETTWFYSDITNLIGKQDTGNTFTYENIDKAKIMGIETNMGLFFWKGILFFDAGYTYMQTEDNRDHRKLKSLDFRPEHKVVVDGRVNLPFGTRFAIQYFYTGERKYEKPGKSPTVETLPEFGLTNARVSHTIDLAKQANSMEIYIEGKNIFDVYYEDSPEHASAGRTLTAGLAFDF